MITTNEYLLKKLREFEDEVLKHFVMDETQGQQEPITIPETIIVEFHDITIHLEPDGTYKLWHWAGSGGG